MPRRPAPELQDRFLNEAETAELLDVSIPALQQDRWAGVLGLPYHKFGVRVRYRLSEVLEWAEARRVVPPTFQGLEKASSRRVTVGAPESPTE